MFFVNRETLAQWRRRTARVFARPAVGLEANLVGVAGFTGVGRIRYAAWRAGCVTLDADLRGVAGTRAELSANGARLALSCKDGRVEAHFDSRGDGAVPILAPSDRIEINQNGHVILRGYFVLSR